MKSLIEINASLSKQEELTLRKKIDEIWFEEDKKNGSQQNIVTVYFTDYIAFHDTINSAKSKKDKQLVVFIYSDKNELAPEILRHSDFFVQKSLSCDGLSQELLEIKDIIFAPGTSQDEDSQDNIIYFSGHGTMASLKIDVNDILYLEAYGSMTTVHYLLGEQVTDKKINYSITNCEQALPDNLFYRVHRRFIVNGNKVKRISPRSGLELNLNQGKVVPIARRRKSDFWEWYKKHEF